MKYLFFIFYFVCLTCTANNCVSTFESFSLKDWQLMNKGIADSASMQVFAQRSTRWGPVYLIRKNRDSKWGQSWSSDKLSEGFDLPVNPQGSPLKVSEFLGEEFHRVGLGNLVKHGSEEYITYWSVELFINLYREYQKSLKPEFKSIISFRAIEGKIGFFNFIKLNAYEDTIPLSLFGSDYHHDMNLHSLSFLLPEELLIPIRNFSFLYLEFVKQLEVVNPELAIFFKKQNNIGMSHNIDKLAEILVSVIYPESRDIANILSGFSGSINLSDHYPRNEAEMKYGAYFPYGAEALKAFYFKFIFLPITMKYIVVESPPLEIVQLKKEYLLFEKKWENSIYTDIGLKKTTAELYDELQGNLARFKAWLGGQERLY